MNELSIDKFEKIILSGEKFYTALKKDECSRYMSWEHCYSKFADYKDKPITDDVCDELALQLAFYLASWGMYRGSSFLLQKDYKAHYPSIKEVMKEEYRELWGISSEAYKNDQVIELLFKLVDKLRAIYTDIRASVKDTEYKTGVSDVLITKILMGVFGCVPAYDRFFCEGIKKYKGYIGASMAFNEKSVRNLAIFYSKNKPEFDKNKSKISITLPYTDMKVLDMCFWQIGYEDDLAKNKL